MNQSEVFEAFDQKISKTCIVHDGNEWGITGKFCRITPSGDKWDIWICNPKDIAQGLKSNKKRNILIETLGPDLDWHLLDREAWVIGPKELILDNLKALGIRRKRHVSEARKEAGKAALAKWRAEQALKTQSDDKNIS